VLDASGRYSFVVNLEAYRNGNDADGRIYTVTVTAQDQFGEEGRRDRYRASAAQPVGS
jgi:hypothetical protein